MFRSFCSLVILNFVVGCGENDKYDSERSKLSQAKAKWEQTKSSVACYVFNSRMSCFCSPTYTNLMKITVKADTIYSIVNPESQILIADTVFKQYRTIDAWFIAIDSCLNKNPDKATVTYDEKLGYPKSISFDFDEGIEDDEFLQTNDSLKLL